MIVKIQETTNNNEKERTRNYKSITTAISIDEQDNTLTY